MWSREEKEEVPAVTTDVVEEDEAERKEGRKRKNWEEIKKQRLFSAGGIK